MSIKELILKQFEESSVITRERLREIARGHIRKGGKNGFDVATTDRTLRILCGEKILKPHEKEGDYIVSYAKYGPKASQQPSDSLIEDFMKDFRPIYNNDDHIRIQWLSSQLKRKDNKIYHEQYKRELTQLIQRL